MKLFSQILLILLIPIICQGQERYIDDVFKIEKPITKTYATKDGQPLEMDIYMPIADTLSQRPLIVFMHGGGFSGGTRNSEAEVKFAKGAAKKGYVAVLISYRLTRKGSSFGCDYDASGKIQTFRLAAEDFMDAVKFLINNKHLYKIDPCKIIAGGSSAGAEAVLNAVYNEKFMFGHPSTYNGLNFAGVFSLAGAIVDSRYITAENAVPGVFFHGTKDNLVPYDSAPHHFCTPNQPGYLILDGSKAITKKLKELGSSYILFSFEGGKHEHAGMPFEYLPKVYTFFNDVILNKEKQQVEILIDFHK